MDGDPVQMPHVVRMPFAHVLALLFFFWGGGMGVIGEENVCVLCVCVRVCVGVGGCVCL